MPLNYNQNNEFIRQFLASLFRVKMYESSFPLIESKNFELYVRPIDGTKLSVRVEIPIYNDQMCRGLNGKDNQIVVSVSYDLARSRVVASQWASKRLTHVDVIKHTIAVKGDVENLAEKLIKKMRITWKEGKDHKNLCEKCGAPMMPSKTKKGKFYCADMCWQVAETTSSCDLI